MEGLNIPAVLLGAVLAFVAGWIWYAPRVLGRIWASGSGIDIEGASPSALPLVLQAIALLLFSTVIGLTAMIDALGTALAAILAISGMVVANGAFSGKSGGALAVDGGYGILAGILMIVAQAVL